MFNISYNSGAYTHFYEDEVEKFKEFRSITTATGVQVHWRIIVSTGLQGGNGNGPLRVYLTHHGKIL